MNYDGSRGEYLVNVMIKDYSELTNKDKDTLHFDIGRRLSEEHIVDKVSSTPFWNEEKWLHKCWSDQDMIAHTDINLEEVTSNLL